MEELKTLGTEYPYREEDFATPEHMESMLLDLAALLIEFNEVPNFIREGRLRRESDEEEVARAIVLEFMGTAKSSEVVDKMKNRGRGENKVEEALLLIKHICSANHPLEARERLYAIFTFGARYMNRGMYQATQKMPLKEWFAEGFDPNIVRD